MQGDVNTDLVGNMRSRSYGGRADVNGDAAHAWPCGAAPNAAEEAAEGAAAAPPLLTTETAAETAAAAAAAAAAPPPTAMTPPPAAAAAAAAAAANDNTNEGIVEDPSAQDKIEEPQAKRHKPNEREQQLLHGGLCVCRVRLRGVNISTQRVNRYALCV